MKKAKRYEAWRFYLQPQYFNKVWRQIELNKPGYCGPGEIEVMPSLGSERCYHIRHHYRRVKHDAAPDEND